MQFRESSHEYWMVEAIKLAKNEKTEVPIAALVIKDGALISKAVNKIETCNDATAHAEIIVIKEASKVLGDWRLNNCILYTALEPCAMCTGAIINSRILKVIFGAYDLNNGACGSKVNLIRDLNKENQIEVIGGILELETKVLLKEFFAAKR